MRVALKCSWDEAKILGSFPPTPPFPNPTLTLTSHFGQNVGLGEGRVSSRMFPRILIKLIVGVLFLLAFFLAH